MNFIEIQTWPEIPQIAFFSSLFSQSFRLPEFDIEDLEEALLLDSSENNTICNSSLSAELSPRLLPELIVSLLKGCESVVQSWPNITTSNYQMFLRRVFRHKCEEYNIENPFNTDVDFHSLPLRTKVEILNYLCEFRLDSADVEIITNRFEADSLRIKPLGFDSNDSTYWYFFGTRLYREDIKKSKNNKLDHIWQVICFTEEDWHSLANKFKSSKSRKEQNLYKCLIEDFLPNIPLIFKAKEAERRRRLFQRRSSQRVKSLLEQQQQQKSLYEPTIETVASNEPDNKLSLNEKFLNAKRQELEAKKQLKDKIQQDRATRAQRRQFKSSEEESTSNLSTLSHTKSDEFDSISTNPSNSRSNKENIFVSDHDNQPFAFLRTTEPLEIVTMPPVSSKLPGRQTNNSLSSITGNIVIPQTLQNTSSSASTASTATTAVSVAASNTTTSTVGRKKKVKANLYMETDEVLQIGMHKVLQHVKNHDDAWPFMDPVEEEIAPKYYSIIKRPMDLLKMDEKLDNGEYLTYTEFRTDFKLIVNNCRLYNGQNNEYTQMVNNLQIAFDRATKKYFDQSSSDEEQQVLLEYPPVANAINSSNSSSNKGKRKHDQADDHVSGKSESKSMKHEKKGTQAVVSDNVKKKKNVEKLKKKHKSENTPKSEQKKKKDKKNDEDIVSEIERKLDQSKTTVNKQKKKINSNSKSGGNVVVVKEAKIVKDHKSKIKHKDKSEKLLPKSPKKSEKVQNSKKHESKIKSSKNSTVKDISADFDSSSDESIKDLITESVAKVSHKKGKEKDKKPNKINSNSEKPIKKSSKKSLVKRANDKFDSLFDELKNRREKSPTGSHITDNSYGELHSLEIKDKFDLIKERRNQDKSPTKPSAAAASVTPTITATSKNSVKQQPTKSKEKSTKKKSKLSTTEEKVLNEKEIKSEKSKAPAAPGESKKNFKQKATLDVLDLETEQTLKDINKWLEHTPRFEYNSESNSPSRYTIEDMDVHLKVDPNDFRKPTPLPLSPSTSKKPFPAAQKNDATSKEPSLLDRAASALSKNLKKLSKKKILGDKHQLMMKKKEVQRTTNRLQPGKTKGNLLCNLQNNNNGSSANNSNNNDELGPKEKLKETKNSLITEIHENSPQLNLGKVLDPSAFNFSSSSKLKEEQVNDMAIGGASADEEDINDEIELSTKAKSEHSDSSTSDKAHKKEPQDRPNAASAATGESNATAANKPNLSAWFKAFGVSKKPNNAEMKKGSEKNENYNASCSLQRRLSTGSSVSEISSIEDSPHHSNLEDKSSGVPIYSSPIHRSPISQRNEQIQKGNYSESAPIRVGFYQDTTSTKSSPEKSCSPHETLTSSSSYQNYSQQSNVFPNQNSGNSNIYSNFYNPQDPSKLRQSPMYDQYKQDYNLEANMNKSISSNASPSSSHQSQQSSPYQQQPISPYPPASDSKALNSDLQANDNVSNTRSPSSSYSQSNSPFHQNPSSPYSNNSQIPPQITNSPEFANNQMAHQSSVFPSQQETPQFSPSQHPNASQKSLSGSNSSSSCENNSKNNSATPSNFALNMHQQVSSAIGGGLTNNNPPAAALQHPSYLHNTQSTAPQSQQLNYAAVASAASADNSYLLNDPARNKKLEAQVRPEVYHEEMRRQVQSNIDAAHDSHPKYLDLSKQTANRYASQYSQPVNFSQPLDLDFAKNRAFDAISRNIPKNNYQASALNDCAASGATQNESHIGAGRAAEASKPTAPANFMQCDNPNIMNSHQSIKTTQPSAVDVNYKQSPLFNSNPTSSMMELTAFMRDFRQNDDRFSSIANPAANYYDKNQPAPSAHMFAKNASQASSAGNFQQIFSNPMTTIAYGREQQPDFSSYQSRLNIFQPANNANQMLSTASAVPPVAPTSKAAKKPKKSKKTSASPPINPQTPVSSLSQHQLAPPNQQQAHHIVPGSAFNYGPPSLPLYGENTASYLEEFRGSQNAYYSAAIRSSSETIDKAVPNTSQAHPATPSTPYHHLIPSHHPSRSYPFMNSLDQYRMMFNQSYQAGYHLGMHNQPPPPHWYNP